MTTSETVECTQCDSSYYLIHGECDHNCPDMTYPSLTSYTCTNCGIIGCQKCILNSTLEVECTWCQGGYYLVQGEGICVTSCPTGTSPIGSICEPDPTCYGYLWQGNCLTVCPTGTYPIPSNNASASTCASCSSLCVSCSSAINCQRCQAAQLSISAVRGSG